MDFAAPETAALLLWTLLRGAALAVLATEAIFLWKRRREAFGEKGTPSSSRVFWAATPALLLAGLMIWSLASLAARSAAPSQAMAELAVPR